MAYPTYDELKATSEANTAAGATETEQWQKFFSFDPLTLPDTDDRAALAKKLGFTQEQIGALQQKKRDIIASKGQITPDQSIDAAYERAQRGGRFEDITDKAARARAQLDWEKTAGGQEWLYSNNIPNAGGTTGGGRGQFTPPSLTTAYKDSAAYQALPDELKKLVDTSFATFAVGTEQDFVKLNNAIKQAQAIVDPFFAAQLALTRASIVDQVAKITKNFEFGERATKRIRDELLQDIGLRLDELGLDEQATLARTLRGLDNKVLDLRDAAASKGTTFGTGRFTLSEDIGQAQVEAADVIQSTRRQANFERQRLGLRAARGDTQAQEELAKLEAEKGFDLQAVGRQAESLLGTSGATQVAQGAPSLAGVNFVGGVLGDIEVQRQKAFASELGTFFDAQKLNANLVPQF